MVVRPPSVVPSSFDDWMSARTAPINAICSDETPLNQP